jgi:hypothetical protein
VPAWPDRLTLTLPHTVGVGAYSSDSIIKIRFESIPLV